MSYNKQSSKKASEAVKSSQVPQKLYNDLLNDFLKTEKTHEAKEKDLSDMLDNFLNNPKKKSIKAKSIKKVADDEAEAEEKESGKDYTSLLDNFLKNDEIPLKKTKKAKRKEVIKPDYSSDYDDDFLSKDCVERSNSELRDYQIEVVEFMKTHSACLVADSTGCGKTLTAVAASQCYLDEFPENRVVFIGPTGLVSNFRKEMVKYGLHSHDKRYELYSYEKFRRILDSEDSFDCSNYMLIIDEAHNIRNIFGKKSVSVVKCASNANKRLLLTATPFVNSLADFVPIINILKGSMVLGTAKQYKLGLVSDKVGKQFNAKNLGIIREYLYGLVHIADCKNPEFFPEVREKFVVIPMDQNYYGQYKKLVGSKSDIFSDPTSFYNGHRRAVNKISDVYFGLKIQKMIPKIKKGKTLIYTNWIEFGVDPITKILNEHDITYRVYSGVENNTEKAQIIEDYNNKLFKVLIITSAGGQGIDLKETNRLILTEPPWNNANLTQIIGRGARFKSHENLAKRKRVLKVYKMVLSDPSIETNQDFEEAMYKLIKKTDMCEEKCKGACKYCLAYTSNKQNILSGDIILYSIIESKKEILAVIEKMLEECSFVRKKSIVYTKEQEDDNAINDNIKEEQEEEKEAEVEEEENEEKEAEDEQEDEQEEEEQEKEEDEEEKEENNKSSKERKERAGYKKIKEINNFFPEYKENYLSFMKRFSNILYVKNMIKSDRYTTYDIKSYSINNSDDMIFETKKALKEFYKEYNPGSIVNIKNIMEKYQGWTRGIMFQRLYKKYVNEDHDVDESEKNNEYENILIL